MNDPSIHRPTLNFEQPIQSPPESIAITGIGCRYPGSCYTPADFWRLISSGADAISEVPSSRWNPDNYYADNPQVPGRMSTNWGGFLDQIDLFDARFFGISPRGASRMDPQQRLLLEVVTEAIDDAGENLAELSGSNTGVYVGISSYDYGNIQMGLTDRHNIDAHTHTGTSQSIAANRISYLFNLLGPSMSVDTACSSSLVATHLACQAIWNGDITRAIIAGVNALLRPETSVGFSKLAMLAPNGRCKAFDSKADGYVRSEGAGAMVLKPLARALSDDDIIYAVIRGTSVNQDGRTNGITYPNRYSQESNLELAYRKAGVSPEQVQYVEAHGTGTQAGDLAEGSALGTILAGHHRRSEPLIIGSVKTNIGHLEAGAGMAGIIKTALALHHRKIPPNLHFTSPNPAIAFDELNIRIPTHLEPWPVTAHERIAGVNSFGFGGTNAHVVLQGFDAQTQINSSEPQQKETRSRFLPLSARSENSLIELMRGYAQLLRDPQVALDDFCFSVATRRSHHHHRLMLRFNNPDDRIEQLDQATTAHLPARAVYGRRPADDLTRCAFVYTGMGPQWWAMGQELLASEPVFRQAVVECDHLFAELSGWSILAELNRPEAESRMDETEVAQPANFCIQVGLTRLLSSRGLTPAAIVGHSAGEVAACLAAGIYDLPAAVRVIYHRSRLQQRQAGTGQMAAVGLSEAAAIRELAPWNGQLSVAAINSPDSVTISGDAECLDKLIEQLENEEIFCRKLNVQVPYHSARMDPMKDELLTSLAGLEFGSPATPFYSTVRINSAEPDSYGADYWWGNIRNPVYFENSLHHMLDDGCNVFIEIGPHPVLAAAISQGLIAKGVTGRSLSSLRREEAESERLDCLVGELYIAGMTIDFSHFVNPGRPIRLPAYPWQKERHWLESKESVAQRLAAVDHVLLGHRVDSPSKVWRNDIDILQFKWIADHVLHNAVVFPAVGFIELAIAAARASDLKGPVVIDQLKLLRALFLAESKPAAIEFDLDAQRNSFSIHSRSLANNQWQLHCNGHLKSGTGPASTIEPLSVLHSRIIEQVSVDKGFSDMAARGYQFGPQFQGISEIRFGARESLARIDLALELRTDSHLYHFPPAFMDAAIQTSIWIPFMSEQDNFKFIDGVYIPVACRQIRFYASAGTTIWSHARIDHLSANEIDTSVTIYDEDGRVLMEFSCIELRPLESDSTAPSLASPAELYEPRWIQSGLGRILHANFLPEPNEIIHDTAALRQIIVDEFADARADALRLDALVPGYIREAFSNLGGIFNTADSFTFTQLVESWTIPPYRQPLLRRLLVLLESAGELKKESGRFTVLSGFNREAQDTERTQLLEASATPRISRLIERCGRSLAGVLAGKLDPVELLFPGGDHADVDSIYRDSPLFALYNRLIEGVVKRVIESFPADRPIRILEAGAGTGSTTDHVLPLLPPQAMHYLFTDITTAFTQAADRKYAHRIGFSTKVFDLERDPAAQGIDIAAFDLIIASNVLHATRDLHQSLGHLKRTLAPGGLLVFLEVTTPARWVDITFGLTDGWWRFDDYLLRPDYPLLDQITWSEVLQESGFRNPQMLTDVDNPADVCQTVILARNEATIEPEQPTAPLADSRPWLIFDDSQGVSASLSACAASNVTRLCFGLSNESHAALTIDLEDATQLTAVLAGLQSEDQRLNILYGPCVAIRPGTEPADVSLACLGFINLLRAMEANQLIGRSNLYLVTTGAQSVRDTSEVTPFQAPLIGVARVARNEFPSLVLTTIDLPATPTQQDLERLLVLLTTPGDEKEICIRGGDILVSRLFALAPFCDAPVRTQRSAGDDRFHLHIGLHGDLQSLHLRRHRVRHPEKGQIEIKVSFAALNFKDVMVAMGLMSDNVLHGHSRQDFGLECSGVVVGVADDVSEFVPGDRVMAHGRACIDSFVVTDSFKVNHIPDNIDLAQAATIPMAYLTAWWAIHELARATAGESILIHAASGGVGLAAVQLARLAGLTILATAGSDRKRDYLRSLGIEHVMDSRTLAFADEVLAITRGRGVDVVLNSLSGEALTRSMAVTAPFGRFIEIGRRDVEENSQFALRPFMNNLTFQSFAADQLLSHKPDRVKATLVQLYGLLERGDITPLPYEVFKLTDAVAAFRTLSQARHIGKLLLSLDDPDMQSGQLPLYPATAEDLEFDSTKTWLISGGLGGFSRAVVSWLIDRGVRHLILTSRRGMKTPGAAIVVQQAKDKGVDIQVVPADITRYEDVTTIMSDLRASGHPLGGVVHAAMVLDDGFISQMTRAQLDRALQPKIAGAWNLHKATQQDHPDYFIMFSSLAAVLGNPSQANYAAGNEFLVGLAARRAQLGQSATVIDWGVIADVGYVADHDQIKERLVNNGYQGMTSGQAMNILAGALQAGQSRTVAARLNWPTWLSAHPNSRSPRLAHLVKSGHETTKIELTTDGPIDHLLTNSEPLARQSILENWLRENVARILGAAIDEMDPKQPISEIGMDSLIALEIKTLIQNGVNVEFPTVAILEGPSLRDLARRILDHLALAGEVPEAAPGLQKSTLAAPFEERLEAVEVVKEPPASPRLPVQRQRAYMERTIAQKFFAVLFKLLARTLANLTLVDLDRIPTRGACIIATNHMSNLEWFLSFALFKRPCVYFVKADLARVPVVGWFLRSVCQVIFVRRGQSDGEALGDAIAALQQGAMLVIAPEGTRSKSGQLARGTTGVARIAGIAKVPVYPAAAWGQEVASIHWRSLRRAPVTLRIGEAVFLPDGEFNARLAEQHTTHVMRCIAALMPDEYHGHYSR